MWSKLSTWPGFEGFKFRIKSTVHFFVACSPLLKGPSQSSALKLEQEEEEQGEKEGEHESSEQYY